MLLSSCFGESDEITQAKQELWVIESPTTDTNITVSDTDTNNIDTSSDDTDSTETVSSNDINNTDSLETSASEEKNTNTEMAKHIAYIEEQWRIQVQHISWEKLLELWKLNYNDFKKWNVKILWKTLWDVSQIVVEFSNNDSDYPNDSFTLKKFQSWDPSFEYNAVSRFKNLDFGLNTYTFTATHSWWESQLELLVMVSENDNITISGEKNTDAQSTKPQIIGGTESISTADLPSGWSYGNIINISETSFTYSDIKWLEIQSWKSGNLTLNCSKNEMSEKYYVTEFLAETQKSWYYWNTCREISNKKWTSFFVTRLDGDEYVYEKHYLDASKWLYGVYELERWSDATSSNLNEINKQLKAKNETFTSLTVVNELFRNIVQ